MKRIATAVEIAAAAAVQLALAELLRHATQYGTAHETLDADPAPVLPTLPLQREPQAAHVLTRPSARSDR